MSKLIPTGLEVSTQEPLDSKSIIKNINEILNLSTDSLFRYNEGLRIFNIADKSTYVWLDVSNIDNSVFAKVGNTYTYPNGLEPIFSINYSGRSFSFYKELKSTGVTIVNKEGGAGKTILDETDNKLKLIKGTGNITVTSTDSEITISSTNVVSNTVYDSVVFDPAAPVESGSIYNNMNNLINAITVGKLKVPNDAKLVLAGNASLTDDLAVFDKIVVKNGSLVDVKFSNAVVKPLKLSGEGKVDLSGMKLNSKLNIDNLMVSTNTPITGSTNSELNITNSKFESDTLIISEGLTTIKNSTLTTGNTVMMGRSSVTASKPFVQVNGTGTISLEDNDIQRDNVVEANSDDVTVILKSNKVNNEVTGDLLSTDFTPNVVSFSNDLANSKVSSLLDVRGTGDLSKGSPEVKLQEFESLDRALSALGEGKMFLLVDNSKKTKTVAYTYDKW